MRVYMSRVLSVFILAGAVSFTAQAEQSLFDKAKKLFKKDVAEDSINSLSEDKIAAGLKEALTVATGRVVEQLGAVGGFLDDPDLHIPLPDTLRKVDKALGRVGMADMTDELEIRLNRAAEAAAPKAKTLFIDAVSRMTIDDAQTILNGPDDAATQYLKSHMGAELKDDMTPVIHDTLADVGALALYDDTMKAYRDIPFVPDIRGDLVDYTADMAIDGLFKTLAVEEAAIRANPLKRTTDLLKTVFGAT